MGKAVKKPVFKLLGGRTKEKIWCYASKLYNNDDRDAFLAEAQGYLDQGFTAMKMRFGYGPKGMAKNLEQVRRRHELVSDEMDIMVECYMGWTLEYARRMLPRLAEFNPRWLEEPVIGDDVEGYQELKKMNVLPISGGEPEFTVYGFKDLLKKKRAVDVSKINAMTEAWSVSVIPHAEQMHNYHLTYLPDDGLDRQSDVGVLPVFDVEVGQRAFLLHLRRRAAAGERCYLQLSDETPGLGITLSDKHLKDFDIIE